MVLRWGIVTREGGRKFILDKETLKEYPLTFHTCIMLLNRLNNEILDSDEILIKLGDEFKETIENQEGLLLGNVPTTQFKLIVDLMDARTKLHNQSNRIMFDEYGAFDKEGNLKKELN